MVRKLIVLLGILAVSVIPCCAKSVNGIETNARQHLISPASPVYNGVYNNHYYLNSCYRTRKVKAKDENGKTVTYTETLPCDLYGRRYRSFGYGYYPVTRTTTFYPYNNIGGGTSITIRF